MGEQTVSATPASPEKLERHLSTWRDMSASRPYAKWLFVGYPIALLAYCGFIGLANSKQWFWLGWWTDLWRPAVRWLRGIVPSFDNVASVMDAKGFDYRVDVVQHLLAIGWITGTIIFAFFLLTILRFTRTEWRTFAGEQQRSILTLAGVFGMAAFGFTFHEITLGFSYISDTPMYAYHRYDAALVGIGLKFLAALISGLSIPICLGALIYGPKFPPPS